MLIEVQRSSSDPSNTMLEITQQYKVIGKIYEEDFVELLTDKQLELLEKGKYRFNIDKNKLIDASKQWIGY